MIMIAHTMAAHMCLCRCERQDCSEKRAEYGGSSTGRLVAF